MKFETRQFDFINFRIPYNDFGNTLSNVSMTRLPPIRNVICCSNTRTTDSMVDIALREAVSQLQKI